MIIFFISSYVCASQKPHGKQIISTLEQIESLVIPFIQNLQNTTQEKGTNHLAASLSQSPKDDDKTSKAKGPEQKTIKSTSGITSTTTSSTTTAASIDIATAITTATAGLNEAEIMKLLDTVSPILSQFGKEHNVPVDQLLQYAHCLNNFHITPDTVASFAKQLHSTSALNMPVTPPTQHEIEACQKMQQNNPEKYTELILHMLKTVDDGMDGIVKQNPLGAVLIDGMDAKINDQKNSINNRNALIVVKFLVICTFIGLFIWQKIENTPGGILNITGTN
jgi:hypothetical protein